MIPSEFQEHPDGEAAASHLASIVTELIRADLTRRQRAALLVPGGRTPVAFLRKIAGFGLPWASIRIIPTDERWVAPTDGDSNERMIRTALGAAASSVVGLKTPDKTPDAAIPAVSANIRALAPPWTATVLGMGEDGHIASLFPDEAWTADQEVVACPPAAGRGARLSLGMPTLLNTKVLFLLISGPTKRSVYERAIADPACRLPVAEALRRAVCPVSVVWYR